MKKTIFITAMILFAKTVFAENVNPIQDQEYLNFFNSQITSCAKLTEKDKIEVAKQGSSCIVIASIGARGIRPLAASTSGNCAKINLKKYLTTLSQNRCKQIDQSFYQPTAQQSAAAQSSGLTNSDFLSFFNSNVSGCKELVDLDKIQIVSAYKHCLKSESTSSSKRISISAECGGNSTIFEPAVNAKCENRKYDNAYVKASDYPPVAVVDTPPATNSAAKNTNAAPAATSSCGPVPGPHTCESWAAARAAKPTYSMCRIGYSGNMAMMCHFDENFEQPQGICDDKQVGNSVNYGGVILTCMPSAGANYEELWLKEYNENKTADIKSLKEVIPKPKRWYSWVPINKRGEWESCVSSNLDPASCSRETIGQLNNNYCYDVKCVRMDETKNRNLLHSSNQKSYIAADTKEADDAFTAKVEADYKSRQDAADAARKPAGDNKN